MSDEELKKISERYPSNYLSKIEDLSCYIKNNPNKYKDHYATLLTWIRKDENEKTKKQSKADKAKEEFLND